MLTALQAKIAWFGLIVLLIGSMYLISYIHGRHAGQAAQQKQTAKVQAQLVEANAQIADDAQTLENVNQSLSIAKQDAANQKAYADAAVSYVQKMGAQQAKVAASWQAKLKTAEQSNGCQAQLEAKLCTAISSY